MYIVFSQKKLYFYHLYSVIIIYKWVVSLIPNGRVLKLLRCESLRLIQSKLLIMFSPVRRERKANKNRCRKSGTHYIKSCTLTVTNWWQSMTQTDISVPSTKLRYRNLRITLNTFFQTFRPHVLLQRYLFTIRSRQFMNWMETWMKPHLCFVLVDFLYPHSIQSRTEWLLVWKCWVTAFCFLF